MIDPASETRRFAPADGLHDVPWRFLRARLAAARAMDAEWAGPVAASAAAPADPVGIALEPLHS